MTENVFANPEALRQLTAHDRDDKLIGVVESVYVDDRNRRPEWVTVRTERSGAEDEVPGDTFVPLEGADHSRHDVLRLAYPTDVVLRAPRMQADMHLTLDQEQELYLHYGLSTPEEEPSGAPGVGDQRPKTPVVPGEADLQGIKELADEPEPEEPPRLRKFVPTDSDSATVSSSGVHGEGR